MPKTQNIDKFIQDVQTLRNEALAKKAQNGQITRNDFLAMEPGDMVPLNGGKYYYMILTLNEENFQMSPKLIETLNRKGLMDNSFIGVITSKVKFPLSQELLPIYGNSNEYVTKWFRSHFSEAIKNDIEDRGMSLVERANKAK